MKSFAFRPYRNDDFEACMRIFDENCPEYLAPIERQDYEEFLKASPENYEVCEFSGQVIGAFGLSGNSKTETRLEWIIVGTNSQGLGVGAKIMDRVIQLGRKSNTKAIGLATSQFVAAFFEKCGATTIATTKDGWAVGYDRIDMVLPLSSEEI